MELTLKRLIDSHDDTSGIIYINGKAFCFTLEDTFRHKKEYGLTRIPAGRYKILLRKGSPMAERYLRNHDTDGMLWLQDVPGFTYIYIHIGNNDEDSEGCILVGTQLQFSILQTENRLEQRVIDSRSLYIALHKMLAPKFIAGEDVYITIIDN